MEVASVRGAAGSPPPATSAIARRFAPARAPRVTVVIPTMNEERNLPAVIARLPAGIHELIVVDARSTDGTVAAARRSWPGVRVLEQAGSGKGAALALGFAAATGDVIVTIDGDGSTDPAEIPRFVAALMAGADLVKGSRFLPGGGSDDLTPMRRMGARHLTTLVNLLFRTDYTDLCYGYNALWRDRLGSIATADGFEVEASMNISASRTGLTVAEVPSFERARVHGASNLRTFRDGFRVLGTILTARMRRAPRPAGPAPRTPPVRLVPPAVPPGHVAANGAGAHRSNGSGPRISVVICAHTMDRWADLRESVASVLAQSRPAHEVIVSVDHADVLLQAAVRAFPRARVVANRGPRGLSGARNAGVRHATGDVVAFLDDDARAEPGWLEAIAPWYADPRVVGVGGHIEPHRDRAAPAWLPPELYWVVGCSHRGLPTRVAPVRNPFGANMSFRRDALDAVGGFSHELGRAGAFPLSCEETELAIRACRLGAGSMVLHVPGARVEHAVASERRTWRYLARRCWAEGLSKALVTRSVGSRAGLASERRYATRVLPRAFVRGLRDAVRGEPDGLARASAVVVALTTTAAAYAYGMASGQ